MNRRRPPTARFPRSPLVLILWGRAALPLAGAAANHRTVSWRASSAAVIQRSLLGSGGADVGGNGGVTLTFGGVPSVRLGGVRVPIVDVGCCGVRCVRDDDFVVAKSLLWPCSAKSPARIPDAAAGPNRSLQRLTAEFSSPGPRSYSARCVGPRVVHHFDDRADRDGHPILTTPCRAELPTRSLPIGCCLSSVSWPSASPSHARPHYVREVRTGVRAAPHMSAPS
jgi:hypothetical protein